MARHDEYDDERRTRDGYVPRGDTFERDANQLPPVSAPVPLEPPAVEPPASAAPAAPAQRRGSFNNLLLDAPNQVNPGVFRGFNDQRALAGGDGKSVKDAFRRFIGGQEWNPAGKSMGEVEGFLRSLIPSAKDYGLNILDAQNDKILIETMERGPEWVDVVQNAGGDDVAWQWLTQMEMDGGGGAPAGGGRTGAAVSALTRMPGGSDLLAALSDESGLNDSGLLAQIQAELEKLLTGGTVSSPQVPIPGGGAR